MEQIHYCVILGETGKGKSSFLNALFKNYGKSLNLQTSDEDDGCTKIIQPCNLDIENDKYIFFDTPGLNDNKLDEQTKKSLANYATRKEYRIKALLICLHIDDKRFSKSIQEMLSEFMNCFPLKEFWKHVLIIRTHVRNKNLKKHGQLEKGIKEKLGKYMDDKKISYPQDLNEREYYFDSVNDANKSIYVNDDIKTESKKVLEKIKSLEPFFLDIKFIREDTKIDGDFKVYQNIYLYKDFNGVEHEEAITIKKELIKKQVGLSGPHKEKRYVGTETDCWGNSTKIYRDYEYFIDSKGNKVNSYPVSKEYPG